MNTDFFFFSFWCSENNKLNILSLKILDLAIHYVNIFTYYMENTCKPAETPNPSWLLEVVVECMPCALALLRSLLICIYWCSRNEKIMILLHCQCGADYTCVLWLLTVWLV